MDKDIIWVRDRLHEQRESPAKTLRLRLKKGTLVEELDWERKTEKVTIYRRLILKNYKWLKAKPKAKNRTLFMVFEKDDLEKAKEKKLWLIKKILEKQYPTLSYSFFSHFIDSTQLKINLHAEGAEKLVKAINKGIKESQEKIKVVEKEKGAKL